MSIKEVGEYDARNLETAAQKLLKAAQTLRDKRLITTVTHIEDAIRIADTVKKIIER
jgi:hypothetical protein